MRRPISVLFALSVFSSAPSVFAQRDEGVTGLRFKAEEVSHVVDIEVDRGRAKLVVTRTVSNPGNISDQAMFHITPPTGAVATRLRTLGTDANGRPVWFEGELLEAEEAAKRYHELTGIGGYYPKDPALLSWRNQSLLYLQVFPVLGHKQKTIEYTFEMPLAYAEGVYHLSLPALGSEEMPAKVRVRAAHEGDVVHVNDIAVERTTSLDDAAGMEIELSPRMQSEGGVASISLGPDRVLVHEQFHVAPRLSEIPRGAAVAVVIDTSKSMEGNLAAAILLAKDFVGRFPDAKVDVVAFARQPELPFARGMSTKAALAALASWTPSLANGSEVGSAITKADAILAASPASAKRMIVISDQMARDALDPTKLSTQSGAIVHMVNVTDGGSYLQRIDEKTPQWSALPRKTGGLLWSASIGGAADVSLYEELARPMRIDHFAATGGSPGLTVPEMLVEGDGIETFELSDKNIDKLVLTGEMWSKPWTSTFAPTPVENKRWSAFVFGSNLLTDLTEDEMMPLAMRGRVVSPVTSFLAIEPGVRPSTEGLEDDATGGVVGWGEGGGGGFGNGSGSASGRHGVDRQAWLGKRLRAAGKRCGATGNIQMTVEATESEIVDIRRVVLGSGGDAKMQNCIAEDMWTVILVNAFVGHHTDALDVDL